jgi:SAM-dependent methyltransferase
MGEITRLPFAAESFDAVLSLHTIYHVPFAKQRSAFEELYRVLAPGRRAAVVYSWGRHARIPRAVRFPYELALWPVRKVRRLVDRIERYFARRYGISKRADELGLYCDQAAPGWFTGQRWPFSYEIACWRLLDVGTMEALAQPWFFGRKLLRLLYEAEERWPRRLGLLGQYPIIEIFKPEVPNRA